MQKRWDKFWHGTLRRPYRLQRAIDTGSGDLVVMLHGIGRMGTIWKPVVNELENTDCRVVALDLLGFGDSPKPTWPRYDVDTHADAVIAAIKRLRPGKRGVILVGHSMGCLISVRVAKRHPELVRHLVLYEMPLYAGLPDTARYKLRLNFYFNVYQRIIDLNPSFGASKRKLRQRLVETIMGFYIKEASWKPFIRSLKHTIMEQTTHLDIRTLVMPMDVIYGNKDRLVIRGKTQLIFGREDVPNVQLQVIKEKHRVSPRSAAFLAGRIRAALEDKTGQEIARQEPLR